MVYEQSTSQLHIKTILHTTDFVISVFYYEKSCFIKWLSKANVQEKEAIFFAELQMCVQEKNEKCRTDGFRFKSNKTV